MYTLVLKNEESPGKRDDGREKAGVNWEVEFRADYRERDEKGKAKVWMPWKEFKATYRGKEKEDAGSLKTESVRRVGIMMRSYFGKQDGDFSILLSSIHARMEGKGDEETTAGSLMGEAKMDVNESADEKSEKTKKEDGKSWSEFLFGPLYRFLTDGMP